VDKARGCVGFILGMNIFILSAFLGQGLGIMGWLLPSVLIGVAYMFVLMMLDVVLLLMGGTDSYDIEGAPDL
jgi:hypothetical protein